jgi:hypothetical protein
LIFSGQEGGGLILDQHTYLEACMTKHNRGATQ